MFIYLNDYLVNTNAVTISGILYSPSGEYLFSVYEHSEFPIVTIHGTNYDSIKEKRVKLALALNNCESHILSSNSPSNSLPRITVKY